MLAPKCATYKGRSTFANPKYLKIAQSEKPRLYEIPYDTSDPANRFCPNGEETVTLEKESRSKLDKDKVKPYDYTYQNSLYETFKPPSKTYLDYAFPNPTAKSMEVLIKTLLMPLSDKTILDSHCFVHELKKEMHDDLEYVKSLEKEIDELESEKADFSNIYDLLLEECVSKDVTCSYLHSLSDLNANTELQCLYLHKVKECEYEWSRIPHKWLNPRASAQNKDAKSHKTTKRYMPVEKSSASKKPERQIPTGHRFSNKKTTTVPEKTMNPRSCLRWKPTGRIFSNVRLRWIPTGKLLNSCTGKVDSEPAHGSRVDIPHIHACKQTLGLSAGTPFNGQKQQRIDLNADALYNEKQENLRVWLLKFLISKKPVPEWPRSSMFKRRLIAADQASVLWEMTSVHISSGLVLHQMTSDHNRSELGIHDHSNEPSSSKLVPKVVPLAVKTATSRQELELLFHLHIAMLRTTVIRLVRLGINPMIQPEPEDLPKDNPKLEIAVLRFEGVTLSSRSNSEEQQMQQIQDKAKESCMTTEEKVDTSKALDACLVNTESSGTESKEQDTSSTSGNDAHADDADIRPIYDEEPMAEVQLIADHNVLATGQQHTEQPEFNNEREVDQNAEQCHNTCPLPAILTDNQKPEHSYQSLEYENIWKPVLQSLRNQSVVRQLTAFKFERPRISKPLFSSQVDVNNDLPKPITTHYFPREREYALAKPRHMIAPSSSRYSSNDMVHNHYLEEAKKKTQEIDRNSRPSVMPSAKLQSTTNYCKPKPRRNTQTSKNWPASKNKKIFDSSTTKVDSKPPNGLNEDITNTYECEQTLNGFKEFKSDKQAMTYDHNSPELGINDHNNEPSSSKLVPKVVPPADKTATSQ
ncbi:hypothetical protein Tco_0004797 [Tanacetum coccineum]